MRRGEWQHPVPGVVASGTLMSVWDVLGAALLRAGPDAQVSHQSAVQIWLGREPRSTLHLLLPMGVRVADCRGVRYHQTRLWCPPAYRMGLPLVPPDVAAAQVCAADDLNEADRRALVTGLVQSRIVTPAAVARAAARAPHGRMTQVRRLVEEVLAGAESGPEAALWRAQVEHRMPVPVLNHPLRGGQRSIDGYLAPLRAGYEVQSREHHAATWLADTARFAEILVSDAISLLPVLVQDIEHRLEPLLGEIESFWRTRAADLHTTMPRHVPPPRWRP